MKLRNNFDSTIHEQLLATASTAMLLLEATDYLRLLYQEKLLPTSQLQNRLAEIYQDYGRSHTYRQTEAELVYGAKVAWRNS